VTESPVPTEIIGQLIRDEGTRRFPYTDSVGKLTIGVGRNLTDVGLSDEEISFLLANDIKKVSRQLAAQFPWFPGLDYPRRSVIVNMAFNLGFFGFCNFHKMIACVQEGNWQGASDEMMDTLWARQIGDRAKRLAQQLVTGEWV
jgi:lysozyme